MDMCCLEECGEYSVRPVLVAATCDAAPLSCIPCLPQCTKIGYCCEKPKPKQHYREDSHHRDHSHSDHNTAHRHHCSPCSDHRDSHVRSPSPRPSRCEEQCKPIKTKYVIPCYRYEDGRIANQPTVLMRLACEVAVGNRPRKKHHVVSTSCHQNADHQESHYIRENEKGNCCDHFESHTTHHNPHRKPVGRCSSCPRYCMEFPPTLTGCDKPPPLPSQNYCCTYVPCYYPC